MNKNKKKNNFTIFVVILYIMSKDKKINTVGKVHAVWCNACKQLNPNWQKMKEMVGGKVNVVEFETDADKQRLEQFQQENGVKINVDGFPTMFKMKGGEISYYNGGRSPEELKTWALGEETKTQGGKRSRKNRKTNRKRQRKTARK